MATVTLAADEVKIMDDLRTRCCPQTATSKFCQQVRPRTGTEWSGRGGGGG
jgi:hypothetical protein